MWSITNPVFTVNTSFQTVHTRKKRNLFCPDRINYRKNTFRKHLLSCVHRSVRSISKEGVGILCESVNCGRKKWSTPVPAVLLAVYAMWISISVPDLWKQSLFPVRQRSAVFSAAIRIHHSLGMYLPDRCRYHPGRDWRRKMQEEMRMISSCTSVLFRFALRYSNLQPDYLPRYTSASLVPKAAAASWSTI